MSWLWIEPFGGIAGDMLLAGLLDLRDQRFDLAGLRELAERLVGDEARIDTSEVVRGSLRATLCEIHTPETAHAPHRGLAELTEKVRAADLSEAVTARSLAVLRRIADAEAKVHGIPVELVHFHEVGAVDTLVDVCGVVWALERLGAERVAASPPLLGEGTVECAHGTMPVPAPGTAEILRGAPTLPGGGPGERTTPTGAALWAELGEVGAPPRGFAARSVGYGAGKRDPDHGPPNLLRVQLGAVAPVTAERTTLQEGAFNLDDATGEEIAFCTEELRAAGCLDVWTTAVQMKKNRPGTVVSVLCREADRDTVERIAFTHSPTLGVRWSERERRECERRTLEVDVDGTLVRVKQRVHDGPLRDADLSPEYEDLAQLARGSGLPLRHWEQRAIARARESLRRG